MKVVIVTLPMMPPATVKEIQYPVDGNKAIEYEKPIRCPMSGILAKTLTKGEAVKVIHILATGKNSFCDENLPIFIEELENINKDIGAVLSYDTVEMEFTATKQTFNKLILDLADKIPADAEIFADVTYGFNPEILSVFCALRFVEEFRNAIVQYFVYGKLETNKETKAKENPMIFDITSLYHLFKLIGSMGTSDAETASKTLQNFFAL